MAKISTFIITKNEEGRIKDAINSVKSISEEIIVVDSGSTDNTVNIAKSLGAKVVFNPWPGYSKQKAYGQALCKNEWVLNLDSDEELPKDLQDEIDYIFKENLQDRYYAYAIKFIIIHRNKNKVSAFAPHNTFIRLYNRKFCGYSADNLSTHDSVVFKKEINTANKIYALNEIAYHKSGSSISQLIEKANFYSSEQAKDIVGKGRQISNIRIFCEFFSTFFKAYILRKYFIFGFDGFIDSLIFAFARFARLAKARELYMNSSLKGRKL